MSDLVKALRAIDHMSVEDCFLQSPMFEKAAARIAKLEAEVKTWQGHAKLAIWGDSAECKSLSAEVDRLVRSRNKWGQKYNKLLLKIRAGESGETDDPASWQLRMALDDANVKNDEQADRIAQLEAALRYALENSGSTQYWGDDDDCGTHSCCGEVSYKPHAGDCWTVKARAALERNAHE